MRYTDQKKYLEALTRYERKFSSDELKDYKLTESLIELLKQLKIGYK